MKVSKLDFQPRLFDLTHHLDGSGCSMIYEHYHAQEKISCFVLDHETRVQLPLLVS